MKNLLTIIAVLLIVMLLANYVLEDEKARNAATAKPDIAAPDQATEPNPETIIVPAPEVKKEKPFQYEPKRLQPLAVGNKWIYQWSSPLITEGVEVKTAEPAFYNWREYKYKTPRVTAIGYPRRAVRHEETYEIVRQDGDHYLFTVTAMPEIKLDIVRDGRYDDSVELCWTWWDKRQGTDGTVGLTESIKLDWGIHADYLLDGRPIPQDKFDLPADNRDVLRLDYEGGTWGENFFQIWNDGDPFCIGTQPARLKSIEVPAGTFTDCLESVEEFFGKTKTIEQFLNRGNNENPDKWETHIFWAPGVGRVYEYQILPDGKITYELKLISYELK